MSVSFVMQSDVLKKVLFLYRIKCAKEYLLVSALNDGEALSTLSTEHKKYLLLKGSPAIKKN